MTRALAAPPPPRILVVDDSATSRLELGRILEGACGGVSGASAIKGAGGVVNAEAEETAVVYGMPRAAAESGEVDELLPVAVIARRIAAFAAGR